MTSLIASWIVLALVFYSNKQERLPDLGKKEDLLALGAGRIVEIDRSIIRQITLHEVREYWIVYEKAGSLHNIMMDKIEWIEFPGGKFPPLRIEFPDNRPVMTRIWPGESR